MTPLPQTKAPPFTVERMMFCATPLGKGPTTEVAIVPLVNLGVLVAVF